MIIQILRGDECLLKLLCKMMPIKQGPGRAFHLFINIPHFEFKLIKWVIKWGLNSIRSRWKTFFLEF